MKRVGITVDGPDLHDTVVPHLRALNAEAVVASENDGSATPPAQDRLFQRVVGVLRDLPAAPRERAAAVFLAHCRGGGELLVTDDLKAFGEDRSARRAALEALCGTPILSRRQFIVWVVGETEPRAA